MARNGTPSTSPRLLQALADAYDHVLAGRPFGEIAVELSAAANASPGIAGPHAQALAAHLARLSSLCEARDRRLDDLDVWLALLDRLALAVFIVDGSCGVRVANRRARALVAGDGALQIDEGRLRAADPSDELQMRRLLEDTASDRDEQVVHAVRVGGGAGAIWLLAWRLRDSGPSARPHLAALAACHAAGNEPLHCVLQDAFGLTRAEARVTALIAAGERPSEVGRTLHISQNAVRFHLKNVFGKLAVTRQTELMRLLMTSPAGVLELAPEGAARGVGDSPPMPTESPTPSRGDERRGRDRRRGDQPADGPPSEQERSVP